MPPLGALTQAWTAVEAALPLGWRVAGLWRFDDLWVALREGPEFEDYTSGSVRRAGSPSAQRSDARAARHDQGR